MSAQPNIQIVRRFYESIFSKDDPIDLRDFIASDYIDHNSAATIRGVAAMRIHLEGLRSTFADFSLKVEDVIAQGDKAVTRVAGQGVHAGEWMGIRPTGAVIRVRGINIDRLLDGRIVEHWGEADTIGMLNQMGVDPFAGRLER